MTKLRCNDAHWLGFVAGMDGEPDSANPYRAGAAVGNHAKWKAGWEKGRGERRIKRMDCYDCNALTLQRVTTMGFKANVAFEGRVPGKKPYLIRCGKCGRKWKTNATYAQAISGDAYRITKV